jgi:hypothetical protein
METAEGRFNYNYRKLVAGECGSYPTHFSPCLDSLKEMRARPSSLLFENQVVLNARMNALSAATGHSYESLLIKMNTPSIGMIRGL